MIRNTIVSYPQRGPWGKSTWRGNCSGYMIKDLIETYGPESVFDPMEGSGTTREVCRDMGIPYIGGDIKQGFDILNPSAQRQMAQTISTAFDGRGAQMIFFHPPYWNMIRYSDRPQDFSSGSYNGYLIRMQKALRWLESQLSYNGFVALLLGDLRRRNGNRTYFLTDDVTGDTALKGTNLYKELRIIKVQHHTVTNGVTDLAIKFAHEYLTILRTRRSNVDSLAPIADSQTDEDDPTDEVA